MRFELYDAGIALRIADLRLQHPDCRMNSCSSRRAGRCAAPVPSPLKPFIVPLEQLGLRYCVTGSVAASIYGEPRLTADIDVVLLLPITDRHVVVSPEDALKAQVARLAGHRRNRLA